MTLRRDAAGGVRSLGRAMLNAQLERTTQKQLARAVSRRRRGKPVYQKTISQLSTGKLSPDSYSLRLAFQEVAGIPMAAWDQPDEGDHRAA